MIWASYTDEIRNYYLYVFMILTHMKYVRPISSLVINPDFTE
jgi:hypothetical protein